jgi:MFS family permease
LVLVPATPEPPAPELGPTVPVGDSLAATLLAHGAIGIWAGVSALALSIGPVVGGALTEYVSWRAIFFINLPVAVGAVVATLFAVRESRDETIDRRVDYPGIVALTASLTAIVLARSRDSWGWTSAQVVGLLAGGVIGRRPSSRSTPRLRTGGGVRAVQDAPVHRIQLVALSYLRHDGHVLLGPFTCRTSGYSALEAGIGFCRRRS